MKGPLRFFSECYRKYPILRKNFRKLLASEDYETIDSAVKEYKSMATLEEMIDSGLIKIVDVSKK